jgi:putative ABC transport system permease protein
VNLLESPLGFRPEGVVTATVPFDVRRYEELGKRWDFLREVLERVRTLPGVTAVSAADPLPLAGNQQRRRVAGNQQRRRVGRADKFDSAPILATQQFSVPGYLSTIGTPLIAGRDFTEVEVASQRLATIIDENMARRFWPEGAAAAVGQRLSVFRTGHRDDLEIVGVTGAVRSTRVRDGNIPHFMLPFSTYPSEISLVVATHATAASLAPEIQRAVDAARGGRAVFTVRAMSDYVADSIGDTRFVLTVLAAFAGAALVLTGVGLYGTLLYLTAQRTREFGIRLALGSSAKGIVAIVMKESLLLAVAGIAAGLVCVAAATGAIRNLLYGVQPLDGVTLAAASLVVAMVGACAAGVPAWRATRADPQASLRSE